MESAPVHTDPPVPADARAAAQAMVARFVDAWNSADDGAYGENYWPDAELVDPTGSIVRGQRAIAQQHRELWASIFKESRITGQVRRVRMLGTAFMMVDFDTELSALRELPPGSPADAAGVLHNHLKHIMECRNGTWRIVAAQNTFIAQPRGA